jgi:hypothetical protein
MYIYVLYLSIFISYVSESQLRFDIGFMADFPPGLGKFGAWQSAQNLVVRLLWDAWPMGPVRAPGGFTGDAMYGIPGLVNVNKKRWKITIFESGSIDISWIFP